MQLKLDVASRVPSKGGFCNHFLPVASGLGCCHTPAAFLHFKLAGAEN
jgi:hypothetical protein